MLKRRLLNGFHQNAFLRCSSPLHLLLLRLIIATGDTANSTRSLLRTVGLSSSEIDVGREMDDGERVSDWDTKQGYAGRGKTHYLDAEVAGMNSEGLIVDIARLAKIEYPVKTEGSPPPLSLPTNQQQSPVEKTERLQPRVADHSFVCPFTDGYDKLEFDHKTKGDWIPAEGESVSVVPRLLYVSPVSEGETKTEVIVFNHMTKDVGFAVKSVSLS